MLQGVGGTIDMDWWFAEKAVILDTAGRLTENIDSGDSKAWANFLRMLAKGRSRCPINGVLIALEYRHTASDSGTLDYD